MDGNSDTSSSDGDTGISLKAVLSVLAAFGILLAYAYQFSFFAIVGLEYASLAAPLDLWSNLWAGLSYGIPIFCALLVLLALLQVSFKSGFNLARWTIAHENSLHWGLGIIIPILLFFVGAATGNLHLFPIGLAVGFLVLALLLIANLTSRRAIHVVYTLTAAMSLIVLTCTLGFYAGFYARCLEPRRVTVFFDGGKLEHVRLVRTSSAGLLVADDGCNVSFFNMSKVLAITPDEKEHSKKNGTPKSDDQ